MNKQKIIAIIVLIAAVIGGYFYYQANHQAEGELVLHGNVDLREVNVAFRQSDRIRDILVEEGDSVKKGDLLARLENRELELNLQKAQAQMAAYASNLAKLQNGTRSEEISQARAKVAAAQASANDAQLVYNRRLAIYQSTEGVSLQEVDNSKSIMDARYAELGQAQAALEQAVNGARAEDIQTAQANLDQSKAEVERLQYLLTEYELRAPSDGVIRSRLLETGAMASPSAPVFKLSLNDKKWIRAYVNEASLARIHEGQEAKITLDGLNSTLTGQIGYISNTAEFTPKNIETEELRTSLVYEIRIYVDDTDNQLRMGMPVTVRIP